MADIHQSVPLAFVFDDSLVGEVNRLLLHDIDHPLHDGDVVHGEIHPPFAEDVDDGQADWSLGGWAGMRGQIRLYSEPIDQLS